MPSVSGTGSNNRVLILSTTVTGGYSSTEATEASADGYGVDIVDPDQWDAMTADEFAAYRAVILGDNTCDSESDVVAAETNAGTWGPVLDGNIEIIGSDPVYHQTYTNPAIAAVTQRAVDFAVGQVGKTGAYISLSCYFEGVAPKTHVSLLDGLDPGGSGFSVEGTGCGDGVHIEATSPALSGIDDNLLSNWDCSTHEAFNSWPANFGVLAVDTVVGAEYTGEDGSTGDPYILASPGGHFLGPTETSGGGNNSQNQTQCQSGPSPINCATGEFWHTFTDLTVPGRGPTLDLTRTYSSTRIADSSPFGYGWTSSYNMSLAVDTSSGAVQVTQENGATDLFTPSGSGYASPPRVFATLDRNPDGTWTFVRRKRTRFDFDASGRLVSIRDLNGYSTLLSYNSDGTVADVTDPAGRTLHFDYDASGHITSITDSAGRQTRYGYDSAGNLIAAYDPEGNLWSFSYDSSHLLTSMTDPRGGSTINTYDSQNRVTSQTDPMERTTHYDYTDSGTTITDPNGNTTRQLYTQGNLVRETRASGTAVEATTSFSYDSATLALTSVTDPDGHTATAAYDADDNLLSSTDALGRTTTFTYNDLDEPVTITDPLDVTTSNAYDANGNLLSSTTPLTDTEQMAVTSYAYGDASHPGDVTSVTDPAGRVTTLTYDTYGQLVSVTNADSAQTTYQYTCSPAGVGCRSNVGWIYSQTAPRGNAAGGDPASYTSTYAHDDDGRILATTDPLGHTTARTYDSDGNLLSLTTPQTPVNTTKYAYDSDNEQVGVQRPDGTTSATSHDADGNVVRQTDPLGHQTTYTYDALDRLIASTDPLGRPTNFTYDAAGNLLTKQAAGGQCDGSPATGCTTFGYDAANELTSVAYSDSTPGVTYTYDADGQRQTMSDGTGTTAYTVDSLHRLSRVTTGDGASVAATYDLSGFRTSLIYPDGNVVRYSPDPAGRMASLTDWLGKTINFGYNADGSLTSQADPNGVTTSESYDAADYPNQIVHQTASSTLASFTYTRNPDSTVQAMQAAGVGQSATYSYDPLTRLTDVLSQGTHNQYAYDAGDHAVGQPNSLTQTFDDAGEISSSYPAITLTAKGANVDLTGAAASLAVSFSSPAAAGDQILLALTYQASGATSKTPPAPPGYAYLGQFGDGLPTATNIYRKTATGGETGVTLDLSQSRTLHPVAAVAAIYRGVDPKQPFGVADDVEGSQSVTLPSVTTDAPGLKLVAILGATGNALPATFATSGMHQEIVQSDSQVVAQIDDTTQAQAGPTGDVTSQFSEAQTTPNTFELDGELLILRPAATKFSYTAAGNRATEHTASGTTTDFNYDLADRLTSAGATACPTDPGPGTCYTYNGDGLRVSKSTSAATATFAWDVAGDTPLLLSDGTTDYIYGPSGQVVEQAQAQPTITVVGKGSTSDDGTGSSLTASWGTSTQRSDQIVVVVVNDSKQQVTTPTGYAKVGGWTQTNGAVGSTTSVFRRTASGGGSSVTVSFGTGVHSKSLAVVVYRGVDPKQPIEASKEAGATSSFEVVIPSITTKSSGDMLTILSTDFNDASSSTWWHWLNDETSTVGTPLTAADIQDGLLAAAGPTGDQYSSLTASPGVGNELVAVMLALKPAPPPVLYYQRDASGSTRLLTNTDGTVAGTYSYDAYGNTVSHTDNGGGTVNLLYGGQYRDTETSFYYLRARYYDPSTSQFLTRDPIEALTQQPYQYAHDNPLNETDPTGLGCGWTSPLDCAKDAGGAISSGASAVGGAIGGAASDVGHWATTNVPLPNSRFITGTINIAYGVYKVESGAILIVAGTAADVTGVGALLGVPAQAYGVYQVTTGVFRVYRGFHQVEDAAQHPTVCKSPLDYGADIVLDLAPGGGGIENLLGGLP